MYSFCFFYNWEAKKDNPIPYPVFVAAINEFLLSELKVAF